MSADISSHPKSRRRLFQFSLRTLLLATIVVAVSLGWHVNRVKRQAAAVAAFREYGGFVYYDYQPWENNGPPDMNVEPSEPAWLINLLGVNFFHRVVTVSLAHGYDENGQFTRTQALGSDVIVHLDALPDIETLLLHEDQATDDGMKHVGRLRQLRNLFMWDAHVSDKGVAHLASLTKLEHLHISKARLTDKSFETIRTFRRLVGLTLQGNQFSDLALERAAELPNLTSLVIGSGDMSITDQGLRHVKGLTKLDHLGLQHCKD